MRMVLTGAAIVCAAPAMAYDAERSEALKDEVAISAICQQRLDQHDLFDAKFAELAALEADNPSPNADIELWGFREGVLMGASAVGQEAVSDDALTVACDDLRSR